MFRHQCNCSFIPPAVTDALARNAGEDLRPFVRATIQQAQVSRNGREQRTPVSIRAMLAVATSEVLMGAAPPSGGTAGRIVYNCQHKWTLRVPPPARTEGGAAIGNSDVDTVYDFAGVTRDYYKNELGRNSIDNLGMSLLLNVHFGVNFMNAFWDGDEMVFGDGDGTIFTSFARSLDVAAHELTHGVTQNTAALNYSSQSGALNEHFSDVFGSVITQNHLGQDAGTADWLIGDEIMGPALFGEALRSMKAPGTAYDNALMGKDPQPDHMSHYYAGPADNQGVHINSGIPNKAFYLVATDIGTRLAAKVWYHGLQNLWATANFADAVHVLTQSARILLKNEVTPLGTPQSVRQAFHAVGL